MSSRLLKVANEHSSVVAVVGKGHLQGIKKHWKQPVEVSERFLCLRNFVDITVSTYKFYSYGPYG